MIYNPEHAARPRLRSRFPIRRHLVWLTTALITAALSGCGTGSASPQVRYKPELLPVELSIDDDGIHIQGDGRIVTPIGEFSIGADYALPARSQGDIYVILRDRHHGKIGFDQIYRVRAGSDEFSAVVNGTTTIEVKDGQVTIDITQGTVKKVQFKKGTPTIREGGQSPVSAWWDRGVKKWYEGWRTSPYKPFMLSRWAYDDTTIGKGYGIGFVWFLIRLAVSLVLGIIDLILSGIFLLAQAAYWFFGPTGRNIVWGISIIIFLLIMLSTYAAARA